VTAAGGRGEGVGDEANVKASTDFAGWASAEGWASAGLTGVDVAAAEGCREDVAEGVGSPAANFAGCDAAGD